jgi:hypothetical protein
VLKKNNSSLVKEWTVKILKSELELLVCSCHVFHISILNVDKNNGNVSFGYCCSILLEKINVDRVLSVLI